MLTITGFKDLHQIHNGKNSHVYQARRVQDEHSVILKLLKTEYPTTDQLRRYRQEYSLARQLQLPGVIHAYGLEEWQRSFAIIFEDFGAIALKQWLKQYPEGVPIDLFLSLAVKIADALGQLHSQSVIHKDINPSNIVLNAETMALKLIDLGISTQLSRENPSLQTPEALEGTLAYLSPEQTGRMNRALDYRTDFYSLGVTFYELLTGTLPFTSDDPMELVHCHIAKEPPSLVEVKGGKIPPILAEIVNKLMAKNAEDRYQSAWGLKADLEECVEQWARTGTYSDTVADRIAMFPLGQHDVSDQLQIPQKLYGRDREIESLLAAFDRVTGNGEWGMGNGEELPTPYSSLPTPHHSIMILVTGYSGVGKSALVRSLYKPITARRGYFISGKFDQFQRNIPYSALVEAFAGLVKQWLGESELVLQQWRSRLLDALGMNGQVLIDVIPEMELVIGQQPSVPELGANEAQNRFNLVFQRFIQAVCSPDHPLVLFLDDMQWADLATLNLLERLLGDSQIKYLLPIVAYRDNEVSVGHPLSLTIAQLQRKGVNLEQITLAPLPLEQVERLMAEALHQETSAVEDLAELVIRKTEGNPFFTNQFLRTLCSENLLTFNYRLRQWQWNLEQIERMGFTDNVVELMAGQLQKLPPSVQEILSTAAYLGTEFDLNTLSLIRNRPQKAVFTDLKIAIERGFITARSSLDENLVIQNYQFGHDRIQQAAYLLIPKDQESATHYQIGQLLLQQITPKAREDQIFELVNHLNYGISLITQETERDELAQLNLIACRKARTASAYQTARNYAAIGLELLGKQAWERQYSVTLALHELAAEAALLCGDFEQMEQYIHPVTEQVHSVLEQINVYCFRIQAYIFQNKLPEAIAIAQPILHQLGVTFPETPTAADIQQVILEIKQLTADRDIADFIHLSAMTDPKKLAIMQIASNIQPATYISGSPLFPLVVALAVKLSLQHGNTSFSVISYALYGSILCNFSHDIEAAIQFGQLAFQVVSKLDAKAIKPELCASLGFFLLSRKFHITETIPVLQEGYVIGLEVGNLEFAAYNAHVLCFNAFWYGQSLTTLEEDLRTYGNALEQLHISTVTNHFQLCLQTTLNLLGASDNPVLLTGEALQELEFLSLLQSGNYQFESYLFYLYKLMLCFLFEKFEQAESYAIEVRHYYKAIAGNVGEPAVYFYDSLIALAQLSQQPDAESVILQRVAENQAQLQQHWAHYAPMNYQHKVDLVEAEKYRILGRNYEAGDWYDRAIAGAKANGYIQEEALANELAAKFYLNWGRETVACSYMAEARYCYLRWGATAKVNHLDTQYPQLLKSPESQSSSQQPKTETTSNSIGAALDLATVMKTSQAIAGEIVLKNLLQTLMKILLENAGAQMGCLLLPTTNTSGALKNFSIAIHSSPDMTAFSSAQPIAQVMPESVLQYVIRTQKSVILDDASASNNFVHDTYIQLTKPLSVLCYPLLNRGKLIGIVYLENNVATAAFTRDRIEFLQLLSGQIAIALTNAQLYAQAKASEQQLKQFLEAVPVGIGVLDKNGHPYYANQRAIELLGRGIAPEATAEEIAQVYQTYIEQTDELYPNEKLPIVRALRGETSSVDDMEVHQGDRIIPLEAWGTPIFNEAGEVQYAIVAFQEITQRKRAEQILADYSRELEQEVNQRTAEIAQMNIQLQQEIQEREQAEVALRYSQEQLRLITDSVPAGIAYVDAERRYRFVNKAYEVRFNRPRETILGKYVWEIIGQDAYNSVKGEIDQVLQGKQLTVEFDITYEAGNTSYITSILRPDFDQSNAVVGYYLIFFDITERKRLEESLKKVNDELERLVTLDGLTQIANRRRFDAYLTTEWQRHRREQQPLALILIDIDYFKRYNDHYGHQGGDECLRQVAQTIAQVPQRPTDLVARYGGEEFAAILPNTTLEGGLTVAEAMRQAIATLLIPHTQSEVESHVTLSLGVAILVPTPDTLPDDLIARADDALYRAKHQGRNQIVAYTAHEAC